MKASELRRGNYVTQDGELIAGVCVNTIHRFELGQIVLEPILLTKETLRKIKGYVIWNAFGGEHYGGYIPFIDGKNLMIRFYRGNFSFTICNVNASNNGFTTVLKLGLPIKHLHELQNFIYFSSLKELEFNL